MITYSISEGSRPAFSNAARMTWAPSCGASWSLRAPPSFANGVRTAATMTERLTALSVARAG
jgi:hypothetical protein